MCACCGVNSRHLCVRNEWAQEEKVNAMYKRKEIAVDDTKSKFSEDSCAPLHHKTVRAA